MASRKISATMQAALDLAAKGNGTLVRCAGGFWTFPGCSTRKTWPTGSVPVEYAGPQTVFALVDRGLLEVTKWSRLPPIREMEVRLLKDQTP